MFKIKSQHLWLVVSVLVLMDALYQPIGIYGLPQRKKLPPNSLSQDSWETIGLHLNSENRSDAAIESQGDLQNLEGIVNETEHNDTLKNGVSLLEELENISATSNLINASLLEEKFVNVKPKTFAELQTFTKAMSMIHDIVLFDNELNMDMFVNKFCSITAKDIMDKMPFVGTLRVVAQITIYEAEGCELLAQHYARKLVRALGVRQREIKQIIRKSCPNEFSDGVKCENRLNELLHTIPSLGHLYSVLGAAVYGAEHLALTQSMANEVLQEFVQSNISQFYIESSISRHKRGGCVNHNEAIAQAVLSFIPLIGTVYNLASSAVYAGKGCKATAIIRAIEGSVDLAMDVASVVSFGGASAAAQGAKIATSIATNVATNVAANAATNVAKNLAKLGASKIATNLATNVATKLATKGAIKIATKGAAKVATKLATIVAAKAISTLGASALAKNAVKEVIRCKRMTGGCEIVERGIQSREQLLEEYRNLYNNKELALNYDYVLSQYHSNSKTMNTRWVKNIFETQQQADGLRLEEVDALYSYTGKDYAEINKGLIDLKGQRYFMLDKTRNIFYHTIVLQNALKKLQQKHPLSEAKTLTRVERKWNGFDKTFVKGNIYTAESFKSTSTRAGGTPAVVGGANNVDYAYEIKTKQAVDIGKYTSKPHEKEFLIPVGSKFIVQNVVREMMKIGNRYKMVTKVILMDYIV